MARATESANIDTAYGSFSTAVTAWLGAGGDRQLLFVWLNTQLSGLDDGLGRVIHRHIGSSWLGKIPATMAAADPGA